MFNNIQGISIESLLSLGSLGSCNCNSSSGSSTGFDIVLISLLKAVSKVNRSSASTTLNSITNTDNIVSNNTINSSDSSDSSESTDINNINTIINTNKIETTAKDESTKTRIDNAIKVSSQKYGIDENLIRSIIKVESNFNPNAISSAGASGLMQIMPQNFNYLGVENPFDIEDNIDGGTKLLKEYLDRYNGNIKMGLMAYNGGPTRMSNRGVKSENDIYKMPTETQNYVSKVMKYYEG